jgi:hypothetical protein
MVGYALCNGRVCRVWKYEGRMCRGYVLSSGPWTGMVSLTALICSDHVQYYLAGYVRAWYALTARYAGALSYLAGNVRCGMH